MLEHIQNVVSHFTIYDYGTLVFYGLLLLLFALSKRCRNIGAIG